MNWFRSVYVVFIVAIITGCGQNMALVKGQDSIDLSNTSIALLTVNMSNKYKKDYQPTVGAVNIGPESERPVPAHAFYTKKASVKKTEDQNNDFFLSFNLAPGRNVLKAIWGHYDSFFVSAVCVASDLELATDLQPNSVVYLGHITALIRERKSDAEERAGSVIPLIDQYVTGFAGGTFDIFVDDRFDEDMKYFLKEYPGLQKVQVVKSILPQWIRPENRGKEK